MSGAPVFHNLSDQRQIILILQPLFEEANRVRRTLAQICRFLDSAGLGVALPDLPGMGEHDRSAGDARFSEMKACVTTLASSLTRQGTSIFTAGFRAGCLFDSASTFAGAWRFAPEPGDRLVRTMLRTESPDDSNDSQVFVQGQAVSRTLLSELSVAGIDDLPKVRTIRIATDRAPADLHIDASPLWRHAEPGEDPILARRLADDLIDWVKSCAAS